MTHDFYLVPASAAKLVLGQAVTQTIGLADPQCSPDAQLSEFGGPCQEFAASVPASGTLRVTLSWSNPDATFVVYARGAGSQETYGDASPLSVSFTLDANATAAIIVQLQASSRVAAPQTYTLEVS